MGKQGSPGITVDAKALRHAIATRDVPVQTFFYDPKLREEWNRPHFSMLGTSKEMAYIRSILVDKATKRPQRFFGEAFVASRTPMKHGWYTSFKWLTAKKWVTGKGLKEGFEQEFYDALCKHLKPPLVETIRAMVRATGKKLVAPDLWIITPDGTHLFIEVKLEKDTLAPTQDDGLKVIEHALKLAGLPVEIVIAHVVAEGGGK